MGSILPEPRLIVPSFAEAPMAGHQSLAEKKD